MILDFLTLRIRMNCKRIRPAMFSLLFLVSTPSLQGSDYSVDEYDLYQTDLFSEASYSLDEKMDIEISEGVEAMQTPSFIDLTWLRIATPIFTDFADKELGEIHRTQDALTDQLQKLVFFAAHQAKNRFPADQQQLHDAAPVLAKDVFDRAAQGNPYSTEELVQQSFFQSMLLPNPTINFDWIQKYIIKLAVKDIQVYSEPQAQKLLNSLAFISWSTRMEEMVADPIYLTGRQGLFMNNEREIETLLSNDLNQMIIDISRRYEEGEIVEAEVDLFSKLLDIQARSTIIEVMREYIPLIDGVPVQNRRPGGKLLPPDKKMNDLYRNGAIPFYDYLTIMVDFFQTKNPKAVFEVFERLSAHETFAVEYILRPRDKIRGGLGLYKGILGTRR